MRRFTVTVVTLVTLVGAAWGQDPEKKPMLPPPPDPAALPLAPAGTMSVSNADLRPGDKAPDFRLDSSLGGMVRLADLKGHWSVLLFDENRKQLVPLGAVGDSIRALGGRPYGICPDGASALKTFALRDKIDFPLLSDPTREISQLFGMYDDGNQTIQSGLVIVDAQGIVRMALQGSLLHADELLQMLKHVLQGA
jgi:peroxiredoxin